MNITPQQHAFITGAASGIGNGIAHALSQRGVRVTIADIDAATLAAVQGSLPSNHACVALDVRDVESWQRAKTEAERAFGPVDILINNAGVGFDGRDIVDTGADDLAAVMAINVLGVQNGIATFGPGMRERALGHIVNTASVMGVLAGVPGMGAYSASKAAVVALSEALRGELAPHGIGVSVLCPGLVRSKLRENTVKLGGVMTPDIDQRYVSKLAEMDPLVAGEIVVQGISENLPYLLTHTHYLSAVGQRAASIHDSATAVTAAFKPE